MVFFPGPLRGRVHSRSKSSDFGRGGRAGEFGSRNGGSPPRLWWRQQQSVRLAFLRDARQKNLANDQLSENTRSADAASGAAGAKGTLGPTLGPSRRGRGAVRGPHARPGRWRTPWHRPRPSNMFEEQQDTETLGALEDALGHLDRRPHHLLHHLRRINKWHLTINLY